MDQKTISYICEALEKDIEQLKAKSTRLSTIRLILLCMIIFVMVQAYQAIPILWGLFIILVIVFFWIANHHSNLKRLLEEKETLVDVYHDIVKRKSDEWKSFEDEGADFVKKEATQANDLDLFGRASLFQYLNTSKTQFGREVFAQLLSSVQQDREQILKRQEAVQECLNRTEFTMEMVKISKLYGKHARKLKKKKLENFLAFVEEKVTPVPKLEVLLAYLLPCITIVFTTGAMVSILPSAVALAAFVITLCIAMVLFMGNNQELMEVESMYALMKDYERMFQVIEHQQLNSDFLQQQQKIMQDAMEGIKALNHILNFVRIRSNSIMFLFVNGFLMMDIHCVHALRKWKHNYGHKVRDWLEALGNTEAIVSLAQLGLAKQHYCFGDIQQDLSIQTEEIRHPLLKEESAVANSIEVKNNSYVITGSNMSGKTTFLRTLGINMVLFQAGAPVCAKTFAATPLSLYTSMRVHDDVSEGISTFYAEILRIKQMMDASKQQKPMLVLIDEIFKGTNSADRILCAKQAIVKLHLPWVITMVSTHDFELCDLEQDPLIHAKNYHFSEYYEDDKIFFDYLLRNGRCTTTNARQLMKLAGF